MLVVRVGVRVGMGVGMGVEVAVEPHRLGQASGGGGIWCRSDCTFPLVHTVFFMEQLFNTSRDLGWRGYLGCPD